MRDPRQEAKRIPHAYRDAKGGGYIVVLSHETHGDIPCPKGDTYSDAAINAQEYINQNFPGRTL